MINREQLEGWQLDGNSSEAYERYLVPAIFKPWADKLVERIGLKPGERVLDVACGTGIVARSAAPLVGLHGKVVGLDLNDGMLDVAQEVSSDILPEIEWRKGDALDIPFPNAAFDVVFCQQGLQFFQDRPAALREMHRVLAPDGRLALNVLRSILHNPAYDLLAEVLERHVGPDAGTMMRSPFPELSTGELRDLIVGAGFRDVQILIEVGPVRYPSAREFVRREAASSPLATELESLRRDVREFLIRDLESALHMYTDDEGIVFPVETHLTVARR